MTTPFVMCFVCNHYKDDYKCAAFPDGIPEEILTGKHDHREPYEGDNGIQFKPIEEK